MDQNQLIQFKQNFSGQIILPGDPDYDRASTTLVMKGAPEAVMRPKSPADVAAAIKFARGNSLVISVKSGGHGMHGYGTNNGGLVIDMVLMKGVEVIDKDKSLVRVGTGNTWHEVALALKGHGLAVSSGDTKTVGVGGLTVGGGIGWMVRKFGLTIDSMRGAEIVTADGSVLKLSETENSDLFWAIRGGGGNFGVLTSFEFEAHKVGKVYAGAIVYSFDDLQNVMKGWRDCMRTAPDELTTMLLAMQSFNGAPPTLIVLCCYAGDNETEAEAAIEPLLKIGKVLQNNVTLKDYVDVLEDAHPPGNIKIVVNNAIIKEFTDEIIQKIVGLFGYKGGPVLQIRSLGGAINRVASEATAFAHRTGEVLVLSPAFLPPTATPDQIEEALRPWRTIAAFSQGSYVNFVSEESGKHLADSYPKNTLDRLVEIKRKYDPDNTFKKNFNIKPNN
jgi:FAD/FMN-containing dehydrogenase